MNASVLKVVLVVAASICLFTADIAEAKRSRKNRRGGGKAKGGRAKGSRGKMMKRFYVNPVSCDGCPKNCFAPPNYQLGGKAESAEQVQHSLKNTLENLDWLEKAVGILMEEMKTSTEDSPRRSIKELNPTSKIRLASDEKFKLLGQMTYWTSWITGSLHVLQEVEKRFSKSSIPLVPTVIHNITKTETSLRSILEIVQDLQSYLAQLADQVGYLEKKGKGSSPRKCLKVKVTPACKSPKDCSKDRDRAYLILHDIHSAAKRMHHALKGAEVVDNSVDGGFTLSQDVMNQTVFYTDTCLKYSCDLQKLRCKGCLSSAFV